MRLINVETLELESFIGEKGRPTPPYAILSHVWTTEEVSFQQMSGVQPLPEESLGYKKIVDFCARAKNEGFEYAWIDTCCIDKTSSAELSEAINSMFQWYRKSEACYVYLSDVTSAENPASQSSSFRRSRWFTRGWTLQELLAPHEVIFLSNDWCEVGTKASLSTTISHITNIDVATLIKHTWSHVSIAMIMSWASMRQTTRLEDQAYSLLGLFDVNMPLIYGEGQKAFYRLQVEIMKFTNDDSLFAWSTEPLDDHGYSTSEGTSARGFRFLGLLAPSVACFRDSHDIVAPKDISISHAPYDMVKQNISLSAVLVRLCSLPTDHTQLKVSLDQVDVVGTLRFSKNVEPVKAVDHGLVITPARHDTKGMKVMCLLAILRCWNRDGYIAIPIKSLATGAFQRVENGRRCRWFRVRLMPLRLCLKDEDEKAEGESNYRLRQFDSDNRVKGPPADPPETVLIRAYVPMEVASGDTHTRSAKASSPSIWFRSLPIYQYNYYIHSGYPAGCVLPLSETRSHAEAVERINKTINDVSVLFIAFRQNQPDTNLPPFVIRVDKRKAKSHSEETRVGCLIGRSIESWTETIAIPDTDLIYVDTKKPSTTFPLKDDICLVFRARQGTLQHSEYHLNVSIEKCLPWALNMDDDAGTKEREMSEDSVTYLTRQFTDASL
ncbi:heterokaryon incompatibility protein-domain-containing protein [Fusarium tricinctum]|uniref:Heterokaryon incompatibility protein-domain-containing protein n=1 Tax=Fusarium tricinctum TaxID=61284 RepID=A0A8K0S0B4_9HYPO|nr:heterokaryon incompatibility protein-domain-containing protein [Fusarium tricinctum]